VEVPVLVERRAEPMDEAHCSHARLLGARGVLAPNLLDDAQEDAQHRRHGPAILAQKVA
jgi:hypothetical protein